MSTAAPCVKSSTLGGLPPKSWAIAGWATVAALSVVTTYLITLILGMSFLLFSCSIVIAMLNEHFSFGGILIAAFTMMISSTVLWSLVPRKDPFEPNGAPIDLSQETWFRAELEALAQTMQEQVPDDIYLVAAANAAVPQRDGKRIMLIGLPLL